MLRSLICLVPQALPVQSINIIHLEVIKLENASTGHEEPEIAIVSLKGNI